MRPGTLLWCALVLLTGFIMFKVKYEVMALEDELARINHSILADQDAIHVLKAEWSFLSQPDRLGELSRKYLGLGPIATAQLAAIDSIPLRPAALPPGSPIPTAAAPNAASPAVADAGGAPRASSIILPKPKPAPTPGVTTLAAAGRTRIER